MSTDWQRKKGTKGLRRDNIVKEDRDGPKSMLQEAVDAVLGSFAKHTKGSRKVDAVDTLKEFWRMKSVISGISSKKLLFEQKTNHDASFICYVTLPGGSCFGSFQYCLTKNEAQKSAAKIALMNSVFNEHPSRLITDGFIEQAVIEAKAGSIEIEDANGIATFKLMLVQNKGKTMLQFQELMTIFRLLHWNGTLDNLQKKSLTRDEVILYYINKELDSDFRSEMAESLLEKERNKPGSLIAEAAKSRAELEEFRSAGRELRFFKEKEDIVVLAIDRARLL